MTTTAHDLIRDHLGSSVPFAVHAGVSLLSVADGCATASLADEPFTANHIGSQHAGALFTLAETASGAAMAGALADRILEVRPLVRNASISYRRVARGPISARAVTTMTGDEIRAALDQDGRLELTVDVVLDDSSGVEVASMQVEWVVVRPAATSPTP